MIDAAALHACPAPGCLTFPYPDAASLAEHIATGDHAYGPFGNGRRSETTIDRTPTGGPAQGRKAPIDETPLSDMCRWFKGADGSWMVRGPERIMQPGATVTVRKANGDTADVTLGDGIARVKREHYDREPMAIAATAPRPKTAAEVPARPASTVPVPEGLHVLDGQAFKVQTSAAGRRYAKRLVGTSWQYEAGAIRLLSVETVATIEQAREYGRRTGTCCVCGRKLTNPASIKDGIGSICAGKF